MTPEEQIAKMSKAINQAIKVLSDPFAASPGDYARAVQMLKESLPSYVAPKPKPAETTPPES